MQFPRLESKLDFVMWVDKPGCPVDDCKVFFFYALQEEFNGALGLFDAEQLPNARRFFLG